MIFWTLLISAIAMLGDIVLKQAAMTKNNWLLLVGMILYMFDATLWFWVYKTGKFSTVAIVYSVFTIMLSVLIGVFYFKEQLGVREAIGIVLGFITVLLLGKFS